MLRQAVLLAGGLGTRLGDRVAETPKPLLEVDGRPFVAHVIQNLSRFGVERVLLSVGYLGEHFEERLGDGTQLGVSLEYALEPEPLGTGGALRFCRERLDECCLVANADTLFDLDLLPLARRLDREGADAVIGLRRVEETARYGKVLESDGRITGFSKSGHVGPGWISGGVYAIRRNILDRLPAGKSSIEADLFPRLAEEGSLWGLRGEGFFIDIGVPEDLERASEAVARWRRRPAVFFDRDGVLNFDPGYVHRPEDLQWMPEAREAVRFANENGYLAIVVTNQSGIGRGYFGEEDFRAFMNAMRKDLAEIDAHFDAVYHCPYHPDGLPPYRLASPDRKPAPGMFLRALEEWHIDREASLAIGNNPSDRQAAEAAGIRAFDYEGGSLLETVRAAARAVRSSAP